MKLINFVTCDDIRQEITKKLTFVGVFDNLTVNFQGAEKWPFVTRMGFYLKLKKEKDTEEIDSFVFQMLRDNETKAEFKGKIDTRQPTKYFGIILVLESFQISGPGDINFKLILKKDGKEVEQFFPDSLEVTSNINQPG